MGAVRLQRVISSSCHDATHQAKNLLCGSGPKPSGSWLSSPFDKSGKIEVEFQLEKPSYIHFIDIGNCGSSSVEIFVKCSSESDAYTVLLPSVQMMTSLEAKNDENINSVRMFSPADLNPKAVNEKWDRVKVICLQSYRKDRQFGLSFLQLGQKDSSETQNFGHSVHFDFNNMLKSPVPVNRRLSSSPSARMSFNSLGRTRARSLLKAAQRKQLTIASKSPKRALFKEEYGTSDLEADIMCFLTSIFPASLENSSCSVDASECLSEYERVHKRLLSDEEKEIFRRAFLSLLSQEDGILPISGTAAAVNPGQFYPSSFRNGIRENGHHKEPASPGSVNGNGLSFDVNFKHPKNSPNQDAGDKSTAQAGQSPSSSHMNGSAFEISPEKRPKRKKKHITMKDMSRSPIKQRRTSTSLVHPSPRPGSTNTPHNDFIQSDGSIPSTSKEVIYCPICDEPFHISEIEAHAATCGDLSPVINFPANKEDDDDCDEVTVISEVKSHKEASRSSLVSCHSDNFVECPICGDMFKQTVVQNHTNMCIENCIA